MTKSEIDPKRFLSKKRLKQALMLVGILLITLAFSGCEKLVETDVSAETYVQTTNFETEIAKVSTEVTIHENTKAAIEPIIEESLNSLNVIVTSESDFEDILNYPNTETLYLDLTQADTYINNTDVLLKMTKVKELIVQGTIDLKYVSEMKSLETLHISYFNGNFKSIEKNNTIKKIIIDEVYTDTIDGIQNLTMLEEFSASHIRFDDRSALEEITTLKTLSFFMDETPLIDMSFICNLNNLEKFGCYALNNIENAECIGNCTELVYLSLNAHIENIDFVENLNKLRIFELYTSNNNIYNIEVLGNCSELGDVSLFCNYSYESLNLLKKLLPECKFNT